MHSTVPVKDYQSDSVLQPPESQTAEHFAAETGMEVTVREEGEERVAAGMHSVESRLAATADPGSRFVGAETRLAATRSPSAEAAEDQDGLLAAVADIQEVAGQESL